MKNGKLVVTVVDHDQHKSKAHTFTRGPVRVGRDPENELHLAYRFVSSWHAVIRFDARSARVEDLGTVNGFLVDGADPAPAQQMRVTIELAADGAHTRLTMTTVFGSQAMFEEHTAMGFIEGTSAGVEQLAALLADVQVSA